MENFIFCAVWVMMINVTQLSRSKSLLQYCHLELLVDTRYDLCTSWKYCAKKSHYQIKTTNKWLRRPTSPTSMSSQAVKTDTELHTLSIVCKTGFETFWSYMNGMQTMNLGILIIQCEPRDHVDDCCFCVTQTYGLTNRKNTRFTI